MADNDPTNTSPSPQSAELSGLARRLSARADSVLLRDQPEQQSDMRQAARFIDELIRLRSEIAVARSALDATIAAIKSTLKCEIVINVRDGGVVAIDNLPPGLTVIVNNHDVEAPKVVTTYWRQDPADAPEPITEGVPEFVSITSVRALLNRLLDHGQASGDEALHADIETAGRLVVTLWDIIQRASIHDPAIELTPNDLYVDIMGDDGIALLRAGIQRAIDSTTDTVTRRHLRDLLGEG